MLQALLTQEGDEKVLALPVNLMTAEGTGRMGAAPASDGSMYIYLDGGPAFRGPDGGLIPPGMPITVGSGEDVAVTVGETKYRLFVKEAQ